MKKVIVKNNQGIQTHGAEMEDPTQWVVDCIANDSWGKKEIIELDADGNPTGVVIPAEYTIEIIDITQQIEQEKINAESLKYLEDTDWYIIREIDSGIPCPAEIKAARAIARAAIVK